jgi:hypothetical protein
MPVRKAVERTRSVFDAVQARIDAILADAPRWTGGKQRLTGTQVHRMLVAEGHRVGGTLVKRSRRRVAPAAARGVSCRSSTAPASVDGLNRPTMDV